MPNPELQGIVAAGANVLPQRVVEDAFRLQHGRTLNFGAFGDAVNRINDWYKDHGLLGQVPCMIIDVQRIRAQASSQADMLPVHLIGAVPCEAC